MNETVIKRLQMNVCQCLDDNMKNIYFYNNYKYRLVILIVVYTRSFY